MPKFKSTNDSKQSSGPVDTDIDVEEQTVPVVESTKYSTELDKKSQPSVQTGSQGGTGNSDSVNQNHTNVSTVVFATHDLDTNGRLDHISLKFNGAIIDSSLPGYSGPNIIGGPQTDVTISGFSNCVFDTSVAGDVADDEVIYISCDERSQIDTALVPAVTFTEEFKIKEKVGQVFTAVDSLAFSAEDKAPPVILKAFAFKHEQKVRLYFSEPVFGTSVGGGVSVSDLIYVDHEQGDANGIRSIIDPDGSDRIITIRTSGLSNGRIVGADFEGDLIACAPSTMLDQAGNAATMTNTTPIRRKFGPDFNGDGREDLIVGAPGVVNDGVSAGSVYLFYGGNVDGSTTLASADVSFNGITLNSKFGKMASSAGDINNDGYDDVLIGAPNDGTLGVNFGKVYVFFGGAMASSYTQLEADIVIHNTGSGVLYGQTGVYVGDVSGDFVDDLVIGGNKANGDKGRVDIFNGRSAWVASLNHSEASSVIIGTGSPCGRMGTAIGYGGDLNADGLTDLVLGDYNFGCSNSGKVSVFHGGSLVASQTDTASNAFILGGSNWKNLGQSVVSAGDINDDGYDDLITGRPYSIGPGNSGQLYVYYGQNLGLNETPASADVTIGGDGESGSLHGDPVAALGDVNGDGIDDFAFGAVNHTAGGTARGRVYVMFGSTTLSSTTVAAANAVLSGDQNSESFGRQLTSAGDINNDGYPDLIVSAPKFDSSDGVDVGRILIYYGGSGLSGSLTPANADFIIAGASAAAEFGTAIGGARQ